MVFSCDLLCFVLTWESRVSGLGFDELSGLQPSLSWGCCRLSTVPCSLGYVEHPYFEGAYESYFLVQLQLLCPSMCAPFQMLHWDDSWSSDSRDWTGNCEFREFFWWNSCRYESCPAPYYLGSVVVECYCILDLYTEFYCYFYSFIAPYTLYSLHLLAPLLLAAVATSTCEMFHSQFSTRINWDWISCIGSRRPILNPRLAH